MSEFICAACNNGYSTSSTPEEKEVEFLGNYGHQVSECDEEVVSLCDYCYSELINNDGINVEYRKLQESRAK